MTVIELLDSLTKHAKEYKPKAIASVKLNRHMNELSADEEISQTHVDAVLVGFINEIGLKHGVDYALYTKDLEVPITPTDPVPTEPKKQENFNFRYFV